THQIIGVFDPALIEPMALVLGRLGVRAALVFHGADGLDELSTTGVNQVAHLLHGRVRTFELDPLDLGLRRCHLADLLGGTAEENAAITRGILSGADRGPRRDVVLLNAAAALAVEDLDWTGALAQAAASLDSGAALAKLEALIAFSQHPESP
ncbi:MAG: anthranilate phosphoribosyltransferase, partial [Caldilineales bacterium]|nr:anthranilate phosphoribosyltransferase [Caldilineales bacterium]